MRLHFDEKAEAIYLRVDDAQIIDSEEVRPGGEIDVVVTFMPGVSWRFYDLISMKEEPEGMFARPVDLLEVRPVECSENHFRCKHMLHHMETIYVA